MASVNHHDRTINSRVTLATKRKSSQPTATTTLSSSAGSFDLANMISDFMPTAPSTMKTMRLENPQIVGKLLSPPRDMSKNVQHATESSDRLNGETSSAAKLRQEMAAKRQRLMEALKTTAKPVIKSTVKQSVHKKTPPPCIEQIIPLPAIKPKLSSKTVTSSAKSSLSIKTHFNGPTQHPPSFPTASPIANPSNCSSVHGRKTVSIREQQRINMSRTHEVVARLRMEVAEQRAAAKAAANVKKPPTPPPTTPAPAPRQRRAVVGAFRSTARIGFMYEDSDAEENKNITKT